MRSIRGVGARSGFRRRVRSFPLPSYAVFGLLAMVLAVGAQSPTVPATARPSVPQAPTPMTTTAAAPAATASPLDEPIKMVAQARQIYQQVRDYTCVLIKQERVRGQLLPEEMMEMKMRTAPFSVYFRWLSPRSSAGQEVAFVAGRNNNMMRVKASGLKGAIGFISISPTDPRVAQNSRHTIHEAGLGNLLDQLARAWDVERRYNRTQVRIGEYEYNKRRCIRVEAIRPERNQIYPIYRTVVYFDKEHHLPVRLELYDWPRNGGTPGGDLLECYSYLNLRFNTGLNDAVFNK